MKLFQRSVPRATDETPIISTIGTAVIQQGRRFLTNQSVAERSVRAARSWFADAKIVQSCFEVCAAPRRSPAARRTTSAVPKYMLEATLRTPILHSPFSILHFPFPTSSCQLKRARRVPASTVVIRKAETERSMNDSAMRRPVSAESPIVVKNLTQNPAIEFAKTCTGSFV